MDKLELSRQEIDRIDREMAALFCRRMEAVRDIASYKRTHGLPILDSQREAEVLSQHLQAVSCELRDYYADYLQSVMDISKRSLWIVHPVAEYSGVVVLLRILHRLF